MHFYTAFHGMRILFFTFLVVVLDQITKIIIKGLVIVQEANPVVLVKGRFYLGESIKIIGNVLRFTYIENPGMAFGIRVGGKLFFTIFASIASVVILIYLYRMRKERFYPRLSLALILGGAVGNLIDRFAYGQVIDFIDIGIGNTRWPVFNIADTAVTIGMIILVSVVLFEKDKRESKPVPPAFLNKKPTPSDEQDNWRDVARRSI
jgi:signal peptidase II